MPHDALHCGYAADFHWGRPGRYEKMVKEEKETCLRLKSDNGILKKQFSKLQGEIQEHKNQRNEMLAEQGKLHTHIKAVERDIAGSKKEIEERDETIQDKEKVYPPPHLPPPSLRHLPRSRQHCPQVTLFLPAMPFSFTSNAPLISQPV